MSNIKKFRITKFKSKPVLSAIHISKSFNERMWYIIHQHNLKENKNKTIDEIINMSNIYINQIKKGCIY